MRSAALRSILVLVVVAGVAGAGNITQHGAAAPSTKYYAASITPSPVAPASTTPFQVTITNCDGTSATCSPASNQTLGSVDITVPSGFTVTALGTPTTDTGVSWSTPCLGDGLTCGASPNNVVQIRAGSSGAAIAPGHSVTVAVTATAPCTTGNYTWATTAKQSNDYSGPPGNSFTRTGGDPVVTVSSSGTVDHFGIALPSGPIVAGTSFSPTITAYDACNNRSSFTGSLGSLTGNLGNAPNGATPSYGSVSFTNGVATPSVTAYAAESNRTLTFSASGYTSVTSGQFTVVPAAPDHLVFGPQPLSGGSSSWQLATGGSLTTFGTKVSIYDQYGNLATNATGSVSLSLNQAPGVGGATLGGTTSRAPSSSEPGVATFTNLTVDTAGLGYTLSAGYPGVTSAATSDSFDIYASLTTCDPTAPHCTTPFIQLDRNTNLQANGDGSFAFLGVAAIGPTASGGWPDGCQSFALDATGAAPVVVVDQRTTAGGDLYVTYGINKTLITKKYGSNKGQQFIPLCVGARRIQLDPGTGRTVPVPCQNGDLPWVGKKLNSDGTFDQTQLAPAVCDTNPADPGYGYFWGIIGSFQDYTNADPSLEIDPSWNPTVTSWTSDTTYRYFTFLFPSASGPAGSPFASTPWDTWITG